MSILFQRALLLAKPEYIFRTDSEPSAVNKTSGVIDATADINDTTEVITETGHAFTSGDLVRFSLVSGADPGLTADTDYYVEVIDANSYALHPSLASVGNAIATGTAVGRVDLTAAVGTFTLATINSDALLVIEPDFTPDITRVERNNAKLTISPEPGVVTRKLASITFQHEVRNNGATDGLTPSMLGRLFRGCGYSQTRFGELTPVDNTVETIIDDTVVPVNFPTGTFTYAKTTAYAGTSPRVAVLVCTTPGGSGVAEFTVFSPSVTNVDTEVNSTGNVMTDATPFDLIQGAQITPTIGADFETGDTYVIQLAPAGHFYEPVSDSFESLTLHLYFGPTNDSPLGVKHEMTGSRGTFTMEGEGTAFGTFTFTFTGDYVNPLDEAPPSSPEFEPTLPPPIELAELHALGGKDFDPSTLVGRQSFFGLCAQAFSIDTGNNVVPRTCINAPESVEGALITGRTPVGSFNPETELEAKHPFWALLSSGDPVVFGLRVGSAQGEYVAVQARNAQYAEVAYGNRDDIRIYDTNLAFSSPLVGGQGGDDELRFVLC